MHAQVGDLCFTGDGIAKKGLLVRHLVMPGLEAESKKIMEFLAEMVSTDCFVNIMEQYHPDAHVGKSRRKTSGGKDKEAEEPGGSHDDVRYSDINRAVTNDEISSVRKAAEAAGLWRFCDPPGKIYMPWSLLTMPCRSLTSRHCQGTMGSIYEQYITRECIPVRRHAHLAQTHITRRDLSCFGPPEVPLAAEDVNMQQSIWA